MSENILEVKGLTKDYGDFVLDKLTFTVPKGVIMGLIGENGAGKSTTINCILNEISKTDGNIEIFGKDYLSEEIEIKDKIGVVFDENHFPDIFTPNEIGTYMSGIFLPCGIVRSNLGGFGIVLADFLGGKINAVLIKYL